MSHVQAIAELTPGQLLRLAFVDDLALRPSKLALCLGKVPVVGFDLSIQA